MTRTAERATMTEAELPLGKGLLVYGVVDAGSGVPDDLAGLDDASLRTIDHGEVAAVVSEFALDRPPGRRRELVGFSKILDQLHAAGAVVPVRFGTVVPDDEAVVEDLLAPRVAQLVATLQDLVGRSQFTVQASYHEDVVLGEIVAADPQIAELRRLTRDQPEEAAYGERVRLGELVSRALEHKQGYDADELLRRILAHSVAHVVRPTSGLDRLLDVALLVDDDHQDDFEDALEELAEDVHERMRLRLLGPMAAYDFVPEV
jgi:hypothetical protein